MCPHINCSSPNRRCPCSSSVVAEGFTDLWWLWFTPVPYSVPQAPNILALWNKTVLVARRPNSLLEQGTFSEKNWVSRAGESGQWSHPIIGEQHPSCQGKAMDGDTQLFMAIKEWHQEGRSIVPIGVCQKEESSCQDLAKNGRNSGEGDGKDMYGLLQAELVSNMATPSHACPQHQRTGINVVSLQPPWSLNAWTERLLWRKADHCGSLPFQDQHGQWRCLPSTPAHFCSQISTLLSSAI